MQLKTVISYHISNFHVIKNIMVSHLLSVYCHENRNKTNCSSSMGCQPFKNPVTKNQNVGLCVCLNFCKNINVKIRLHLAFAVVNICHCAKLLLLQLLVREVIQVVRDILKLVPEYSLNSSVLYMQKCEYCVGLPCQS